MTDWKDVTDRVKASRELEPEERETTINFVKADDTFAVYSEEKSIVKALLENEHATIEWVVIEDSDGRYEQSDNPDEVKDINLHKKRVTGVSAELPIGCLTIKSKPRQRSTHSQIVSV